MKKIISLCFIFIILAWSHESMANLPSGLKEVYKVGVATDVISYSYEDKAKITGYDIDVLEYIAKKLNFEIHYIKLSRSQIKQRLRNNTIDIGLIHALTRKDEDKLYLKSLSIYDVTFNLICGKNTTKISDLQDIAGKTVVTMGGSVENQIISDLASKSDILSYSLTDSAHINLEQEVLSNRANCTFLIYSPYFQDFNIYSFASNLFRDYTTQGGVSFLYPLKDHDLLKKLMDNQIIYLKLKKIDVGFKDKYNVN